MRLFGLIGYPLSHSFSRNYFSEKFEREGLTDCRYDLFPIPSIDELGQLITQTPGLEGLNVTVAYKKQVLQYLTSTANIPEGIRACNCIKIEKHRLLGYNTDWIGFEKSFTPLVRPQHRKALVFGKGGASEAILFVLRKMGIEFTVATRSAQDRSTITYKDIDQTLINDHTVIINTTSLGMYPDITTCPDIPYQYISGNHLLYDLVYNPAKTLFLQKGEEQGAMIKNGEEMLHLQAEESWRIWNS